MPLNASLYQLYLAPAHPLPFKLYSSLSHTLSVPLLLALSIKKTNIEIEIQQGENTKHNAAPISNNGILGTRTDSEAHYRNSDAAN